MSFFSRSIFIGLGFSLFSVTASAANIVLEIQNNFGSRLLPRPLFFTVDHKPVGTETLILPANLKKHFVLGWNKSIKTYVVYQKNASTYVRVSGFPGDFTTKDSAFWSVDVEMVPVKVSHNAAPLDKNGKAAPVVPNQKEQLNIHGYVSKGIAYTWKEESDRHIIAFCKPAYYDKHGSCFK